MPGSECSPRRRPPLCANICSMASALAQLSLDGADRLVERLRERRAPLPAGRGGALPVRAQAGRRRRSSTSWWTRSSRPTPGWPGGPAGEVALTEWEELASLVDLPLEEAPYVVFDLETTGTRPGVSRIVEIGAVRMRGFEAGGRVRAAGRSRRGDAGDDHPHHRHRRPATCAGAPRIERVLPEFLRVRRGRGAGRAQRPLRRRLRRRRAVAAARPPAGGAGDGHGDARPAAAGRPAAADEPGHAGGAVRHRGAALPPRAARRPGHRPRCWSALLGLAQERGARTVADAIALAAPGAAVGARAAATSRATCPAGPASTCSATAPSRCSTSARRPTCAPACARTSRGRRSGARSSTRWPPPSAIETRPLGSELEAALVELELIGRLRPPANSRNAHPERACYLTLTHGEPVPRLAVTDRPQPDLRARSVRCRRAAARRRPRRRCAPPSASAPAGRRCRTARRAAWPACWAAAGRRAAAAPTPSGTRRRCSRSAPGWRRRSRASSCGRCGCGWRRCAEAQRYEDAATARDQLEAVDSVRRTMSQAAPRPRPQRRAAGARPGRPLRPGVRRARAAWWSPAAGVPRSGDGRLEIAPLVVALEAGMTGPPRSLRARAGGGGADRRRGLRPARRPRARRAAGGGGSLAGAVSRGAALGRLTRDDVRRPGRRGGRADRQHAVRRPRSPDRAAAAGADLRPPARAAPAGPGPTSGSAPA